MIFTFYLLQVTPRRCIKIWKLNNASRETPQLHSKLTFRNIILTIQRGFEKINAWCLAKVNSIIKDFSKQESTTYSKEMMLFFVVDDTSKKILRWSYFNNSTEFQKNNRLMLNKGNWSYNSLFKARVNTTFQRNDVVFCCWWNFEKNSQVRLKKQFVYFFSVVEKDIEIQSLKKKMNIWVGFTSRTLRSKDQTLFLCPGFYEIID